MIRLCFALAGLAIAASAQDRAIAADPRLVVEVVPVRMSIMPEGLFDGLTDQEMRDLIAFLASRK